VSASAAHTAVAALAATVARERPAAAERRIGTVLSLLGGRKAEQEAGGARVTRCG
jgi:hypothetical protein